MSQRQHTADIEMRNVSISYSSAAGRVAALQDISLRVRAGEFVALVGPSGSGKTSLLRAVGGLLDPDAGLIQVGGYSPAAARAARMISFVFQQPVLLPWRSALHNIELPLQVFGWPPARRRAVAEQMLALVGLERFANAYPQQLSGGMQQRVALARALAFDPAVLLMDEPFGALDEITRERLNVELMRIWASTGSTVLFVTHALSEAAFLADRVLILSASPGRVLADLPIQLPRPRTAALLEQEDFLHCVAWLRQEFRRCQAEAVLSSDAAGPALHLLR